MSGESWLAKLKQENELVLSRIKERLLDGEEIIPFVGAGMSAQYGYLTLDKLLKKAYKYFPENDLITKEVETLINQKKLEKAISRLGRDEEIKRKFKNLCKKEFSKDNFKQKENVYDRIYQLIELASKYVVTTNFDKCLEGAFGKSKKKFQEVHCQSTLEELDKSTALKPILIKLHGTVEKTAKKKKIKDWVMFEEDYKEAYFLDDEEENIVDPGKKLPILLRILASSGIFLFVGCRLKDDSVIEVFEQLNGILPIGQHYAIIELPENIEKEACRDEVNERTTQLKNAGIEPIWYKNGDYSAISKYIKKIKEDITRKNDHNKFANIVADNARDAMQDGSIVRISSVASQYQTYSERILEFYDEIGIIIWSMYGSPLNIPLSAECPLTSQDLAFQNIKADHKFRIIIFEDIEEIKDYKKPKEIRDQDRKAAFEESVEDGDGKLLFGLIGSLKDIKHYFDFGYMSSKHDVYNLLVCSTFRNSDFNVTRKRLNTLDDVVTHSPSIKSNTLKNYKPSPLKQPKRWNINFELRAIQEVIECIIHCTMQEKQNNPKYFNKFGLYTKIDDLDNYKSK